MLALGQLTVLDYGERSDPEELKFYFQILAGAVEDEKTGHQGEMSGVS